MKQLLIIIKPFQATAVLEVVAQHEVEACFVDEVKGYGRQKNNLEQYRGSEYNLAFLPKVEITLCVPAARAEEAVEKLARAARTGRMGDGKIFVVPLAWEEIEF